jgi:3-isopropylmalate dehydrogenase
MNLNIAILAGDGIGPEVTDQTVNVLKAVAEKFNHKFNFIHADVGAAAIDKTGDPLPEETLKICKEADAILFGAVGDLEYDNNPNAKIRPEQGLLRLRKSLGLYANIRPTKAYEPLIHKSPLKEKVIKGTDFIIFRELTGGIYYGEKTLSADGKSASDECTYTTTEIDKITHLAFKEAKSRKRKVTLIDKANVLETSRLWRRRVKEIAKDYPGVTLELLFADTASMQLIKNPRQFDIILTENLFGDILSDEASVISGSIGLSSSASIGDKHAMFKPAHGSFPKAKGKNIANPMGTILSGAMLLEHFDLYEEAEALRQAAEKSIELQITTQDINSSEVHYTNDIGEFISDYIIDKRSLLYNKENIDLGQSTII